jgi:16S rRNA (adenine1518-N6/adenine1519-N6)-dimethyltransferase
MKLKKQRLLAGAEEQKFFAVVKAAFSQRRKTLLNSLSGAALSSSDPGSGVCCPILTKSRVSEALAAAGIDPQRRPETLTIEEFRALTEAFER